MGQRYVPNEVFLVCTDGMKKSQLKVSSQSSVVIANGKLAATINDRFQGNFFCAKMVIAGAIIGAIAAALFVAATILTGGAVAVGTAALIGAGAAAGGAAVGASVALMPSICSMLTSGSDWVPVHPKVRFEKQPALIEQSKIPCMLGGNVMIFYTEAAAEEFTDLKTATTLTQVGGIILGSALLSGGVATILSAGSVFLGNLKLINGAFGTKAALVFAGEGAAWFGFGLGASVATDELKEWGFMEIQEHTSFRMHDYSENKTVEEADELTGASDPLIEVDIPGTASDVDPYADASEVLKDNHSPNISDYHDLEYERRTGIHTNDGSVIEETELDRTHNRNPNAIPERNPTRTSVSDLDHQGDPSGTYYNRETYNLEEGRQLEGTSRAQAIGKAKAALKNAKPSPLEIAIDVYNIMLNKLLEAPVEDYKDSLKAEAAARQSIKVVETNV
jgi:hypothetical protein